MAAITVSRYYSTIPASYHTNVAFVNGNVVLWWPFRNYPEFRSCCSTVAAPDNTLRVCSTFCCPPHYPPPLHHLPSATFCVHIDIDFRDETGFGSPIPTAVFIINNHIILILVALFLYTCIAVSFIAKKDIPDWLFCTVRRLNLYCTHIPSNFN